MANGCECKQVTVNVCGCCGHGDGNGTGGGAVGEWKLLGALNNMTDELDLKEIEFSDIMVVAFAGYWHTGSCCKEALEVISKSDNPFYIMPSLATSSSYEATYAIFELVDMKIKVRQISKWYNLVNSPITIYYR